MLPSHGRVLRGTPWNLASHYHHIKARASRPQTYSTPAWNYTNLDEVQHGRVNGPQNVESVLHENPNQTAVHPETSKKARRRPKKSLATGGVKITSRAERRPKSPKAAALLPARLIAPGSPKHHDLASFLAHAEQTSLSTSSTVYKGTLFEYTVAQTLKDYNFTLRRSGRSNDLGIDLIGHWSLPGRSKDEPPLPVLVQCKAAKSAKPSPAMVRELEGAYGGAPAGWRHRDGVLALLVSTCRSTKGVREAIQRSNWPLGVVQITPEDCRVKQFLWNTAASRVGLQSMSVAVQYQDGRDSADAEDEDGETADWRVALMWKGRLWRPKGTKAASKEQPTISSD